MRGSLIWIKSKAFKRAGLACPEAAGSGRRLVDERFEQVRWAGAQFRARRLSPRFDLDQPVVGFPGE
jgi:hypothetical protein